MFEIEDHAFEHPQDSVDDRCVYRNCGKSELQHLWTVNATMNNEMLTRGQKLSGEQTVEFYRMKIELMQRKWHDEECKYAFSHRFITCPICAPESHKESNDE